MVSHMIRKFNCLYITKLLPYFLIEKITCYLDNACFMNLYMTSNKINKKLSSKRREFIVLGPNKCLKENKTDSILFGLEHNYFDPSKDNNYAIQCASQNGNEQLVKILLNDPRVDPSAMNNSAILWACKNGHANIVKLLLADPRANPTASSNIAFQWAHKRNDYQMVQILLRDCRVDGSADINTAITNSILNRNFQMVKILLSSSRIKTCRLYLCIAYACFYGNDEIVKILLKNSNINIYDSGSLHSLFLDIIFDVDIYIYRQIHDWLSQFNCIQLACQGGSSSIVEMLLNDPRADPTIANNYCIQEACRRGHSEIVKMLLRYPRVDPTVDNNYCIKEACRKGYLELVKILLGDPRIDPTVDNNYCIKEAHRTGYLEIVKILLEDPRVDPASISGLTPTPRQFSEIPPPFACACNIS